METNGKSMVDLKGVTKVFFRGKEQLRVLEYGHKIRVCLTAGRTLEINTPDEYAAAQARMATA